MVVKLHTDEYTLLPALLFALTRQKYFVLFEIPLPRRFAASSVHSSCTAVFRSGSGDTCTR